MNSKHFSTLQIPGVIATTLLNLLRELRDEIYTYLTTAPRIITLVSNKMTWLSHGPMMLIARINHQLRSEYMDHIRKVADLHANLKAPTRDLDYPAPTIWQAHYLRRVTINIRIYCTDDSDGLNWRKLAQSMVKYHLVDGNRYLANSTALRDVRYKVRLCCVHGEGYERRKRMLGIVEEFREILGLPCVSCVEVAMVEERTEVADDFHAEFDAPLRRGMETNKCEVNVIKEWMFLDVVKEFFRGYKWLQRCVYWRDQVRILRQGEAS